MIKLMLISTLLLGSLTGCEEVISKSEAVQVADVNGRNALAAARRLEARIEELESKVRDLEGEVDRLRWR